MITSPTTMRRGRICHWSETRRFRGLFARQSRGGLSRRPTWVVYITATREPPDKITRSPLLETRETLCTAPNDSCRPGSPDHPAVDSSRFRIRSKVLTSCQFPAALGRIEFSGGTARLRGRRGAGRHGGGRRCADQDARVACPDRPIPEGAPVGPDVSHEDAFFTDIVRRSAWGGRTFSQKYP